MKPHLQPIHIALKANIPVAFLAHSLGPFDDPEERDRFTNVANQAKLISVREGISKNYLTQTLNLPESKVHQTADVAFLLKPPSDDFGQRALTGYGLTPALPIIAVTPSQGIQRFATRLLTGSPYHSLNTRVYSFGTQRTETRRAQYLVIIKAILQVCE